MKCNVLTVFLFLISAIFGISTKMFLITLSSYNLETLFWFFATLASIILILFLIKKVRKELWPEYNYILVKIGRGGQVENLLETKNLSFARELAVEWHKKDPENIFPYLDYAVLRKEDDEYVFFSTGRWNVAA